MQREIGWPIYVALALVLLCGAAWHDTGYAASHLPGGEAQWRLTFEDDFDGETLDLTKWRILPSKSPVAPRVDAYWSREQTFVDGEGHLIIQVDEVDGEYHAGAVDTKGNFEQAYGYYEARVQLPTEEGFWTAFWLMTDGVLRVGDEGRDGTEIDIYEAPYATEDRIHHALHWDGYGEHHRVAGHNVLVPGIHQGFHTFALEWNVDEYVF